MLYTHGHADHILGLDDIRAFNIKQRAAVPIYASATWLLCAGRLLTSSKPKPRKGGILPGVDFHPITGSFKLFDAQVIPIPAMHGPLPVLGYRIGTIGYLTDFSAIGEESATALAANASAIIWYSTRCDTLRTRCIRR